MNISAKTEYACLAVLELAANFGTGQPVRVRQIAETHGIPPRFLVQILLQLKGAGLVTSTRGASGGYQLVKSPEDITLGDVMALLEGPAGEVTTNAGRETVSSQVLQQVWSQVSQVQRDMLAATTFADLVERVQGENENMYYI